MGFGARLKEQIKLEFQAFLWLFVVPLLSVIVFGVYLVLSKG